MKFMSLEWMLLKAGKKVKPVLKIPLSEKDAIMFKKVKK